MSSRDMTINQIKAVDKNFGAKHTIKVNGFKEPKDKIPPWFKKFHEEEFKPLVEKVNRMQNEPPKYFTDFANKMLAFVEKQEQFNQFVLDQFKKHGWTK